MPGFFKHNSYNLWFSSVTWIYISFALLSGFLIPQLNRWIFKGWISQVDKSTLITIFSSVASGMITLSGLVFSLIFVLVQFGSATYSPRITRIFAHTHVLHHSLGIFTGTFLYSLMAMRTIGMQQTEQVSGLTTWLGFIWLLGSVGILAKLVGVFATITITNVLTLLGRTGRAAIKRVYGPYISAQSMKQTTFPVQRENKQNTTQQVFYEGDPGYVTGYETSRLLALAVKTDVFIELPYAIGDSVKDGAAIALIHGAKVADIRSKAESMISLEHERVFLNDPKYAIRLLVDTAIRALSPAVNDPTTAVQSLDHIESLLRRLGNSDLNVGVIRDSTGTARVMFKTPAWEDYLQLGLSEIMQYGAASIQVERRLEALLQFLEQSVPSERAREVKLFKENRRIISDTAFANKSFREWAESADREGIGSQSDGIAGTARGMEAA